MEYKEKYPGVGLCNSCMRFFANTVVSQHQCSDCRASAEAEKFCCALRAKLPALDDPYKWRLYLLQDRAVQLYLDKGTISVGHWRIPLDAYQELACIAAALNLMLDAELL